MFLGPDPLPFLPVEFAFDLVSDPLELVFDSVFDSVFFEALFFSSAIAVSDLNALKKKGGKALSNPIWTEAKVANR